MAGERFEAKPSVYEIGEMITKAPSSETAEQVIQLGYGARVAAEIETFARKEHDSIARLLIAQGHATEVARFFTSFELKKPADVLTLIIGTGDPQAIAMVVEQFGSYTVPRGERPPQLSPADARAIGRLLLATIDGLHGELENLSYEPRLGDVLALEARVQGVLERLPR